MFVPQAWPWRCRKPNTIANLSLYKIIYLWKSLKRQSTIKFSKYKAFLTKGFFSYVFIDFNCLPGFRLEGFLGFKDWCWWISLKLDNIGILLLTNFLMDMLPLFFSKFLFSNFKVDLFNCVLNLSDVKFNSLDFISHFFLLLDSNFIAEICTFSVSSTPSLICEHTSKLSVSPIS